MYYDERPDETVSMGNWIGTFLLMLIPVLNLILALVWAFGGMTKPSKRNYARAWLIVAVVSTGLAVAGAVYMWAQITALANEFSTGFYR